MRKTRPDFQPWLLLSLLFALGWGMGLIAWLNAPFRR
jgi:hypothetical protein